MYAYTLWQPRDPHADGFRPWDMVAVRHAHGIDPARYRRVYEGTIDAASPREALDGLFIQFNVDHPADLRGWSLSMGDLVTIDGDLYYCDALGWVAVDWAKSGS